MESCITDIFVGHLYEMSQSEFRPSVIEQARLCLLDYYGVTMAGAEMLAQRNVSFLRAVHPSSMLLP